MRVIVFVKFDANLKISVQTIDEVWQGKSKVNMIKKTQLFPELFISVVLFFSFCSSRFLHSCRSQQARYIEPVQF